MSEAATAKDNGQPPPRWILKIVTRLHVLLNRISGGRLFNTLGGDEVCFVDMRGAKSGKQYTIPLMYVPWKEGVVLVASQGGAPKNPVWYYNLKANPDIDVRWREKSWQLRARLASDEEKTSIWPVCDEHYAPFAEYRQRTSRNIPIFICEPRA